jgi:hypothetical protein
MVRTLPNTRPGVSCTGCQAAAVSTTKPTHTPASQACTPWARSSPAWHSAPRHNAATATGAQARAPQLPIRFRTMHAAGARARAHRRTPPHGVTACRWVIWLLRRTPLPTAATHSGTTATHLPQSGRPCAWWAVLRLPAAPPWCLRTPRLSWSWVVGVLGRCGHHHDAARTRGSRSWPGVEQGWQRAVAAARLLIAMTRLVLRQAGLRCSRAPGGCADQHKVACGLQSGAV